jgi:hypothetical protein
MYLQSSAFSVSDPIREAIISAFSFSLPRP